uniref:Ribonuclease A-domain domain-containing protein n=1 Tax=Poecilia formosa TaxID=48698 RepID=A0A087X7U8_POEFO
KERYEKFKAQHINNHISKDKCSLTIHKNPIFSHGNCKETNTFIVSKPGPVMSIWEDEGIPVSNPKYKRNLTQSTKTFTIVVCEFQRKLSKGWCDYTGKRKVNRIVIVGCAGGLPVHYEVEKVAIG